VVRKTFRTVEHTIYYPNVILQNAIENKLTRETGGPLLLMFLKYTYSLLILQNILYLKWINKLPNKSQQLHRKKDYSCSVSVYRALCNSKSWI